MPNPFRPAVLALAAVALAAPFAFAEDKKEAEAEAPVVAPDFSAATTAGKELKLSDYKGKVVILDFWATWCPPCRAEIPSFVDLAKEHAKDGLVVIGISLDQDPEKLKAFLEENHVEYPVVLDGDHAISTLYREVPGTEGLEGIPTTLIIDRAGMVRKVLVGGHEKEAFEELIAPLLKEKAPEAPKKEEAPKAKPKK